MYISKAAEQSYDGFPPNYNGNLRHEPIHIENPAPSPRTRYKYKRKITLKSQKKQKCEKNAGSILNDDIILIGLIVFLYVGCEHTKENLILMGVLAYLLLGCQDS